MIATESGRWQSDSFVPNLALFLEYRPAEGPPQIRRVEDGLVIGRDPDCALVIDDVRVSRRHARVVARGGVFVVVDAGSRNGTTVDGASIEEHPLDDGVRFDVGGHEVRVMRLDRPDDVGPATAPNAPIASIADGEEKLALDRQVWAATEHAAFGAQTRDSAARLEVLYRGALMLARAVDLEEVIEIARDACAKLVGADEVAIFECESDALDESDDGALKTLHPLGVRGFEDALPAVWANKALEERRALLAPVGDGVFVLAATMRIHKRVIGALVARATRPRFAPNVDDLQLFVAWASQVAALLEHARARARLAEENTRLRARLLGGNALMGTSEMIREVAALVQNCAASESTVLIQGETGTGKELVASQIHAQSARRAGPFVAINCGALTPSLMESELFGHERGAFTGADRQKPGLFERAQGGTVFLDEAAELSPDAQVRLLRVLETRRVMRVGGTQEIGVDVRLLAATHRDLRSLVSAGTFRQDLLYRILVLVIELPPLRAHLEDVRVLAEHLLDEMRGSLPRRICGFTEDAFVKLETHLWPGNVRELRNTIERAAVLGRGEVISARDVVLFAPTSAHTSTSDDASRSLKDIEAAHVQRVLESVGWNKARAAEILGIGRPTVYEKIKQHGLHPAESTSDS